jgi:hypothetical protein
MAAPTNVAFVKKVLANPEPSTHGPNASISNRRSANYGNKSGGFDPWQEAAQCAPHSHSFGNACRDEATQKCCSLQRMSRLESESFICSTYSSGSAQQPERVQYAATRRAAVDAAAPNNTYDNDHIFHNDHSVDEIYTQFRLFDKIACRESVHH